jgi:Ca2+-binding RTX toxin-like protein
MRDPRPAPAPLQDAALRAAAGGFVAFRLDGSPGADTLDGARWGTLILGGAGDDLLRGGAGGDILQGGAGNDRLEGGAGDDELQGGRGSDLLDGGAGDDLIDTTPDGPDDPDARMGTDLVLAGAGDDTILAALPQDGAAPPDFALVDGGAGSDTLVLQVGGREEEVRGALLAQLAAKGIAHSVEQDGTILLDMTSDQTVGGVAHGFLATNIERIVFR